MNAALVALVRGRAREQCEYCLLPQSLFTGGLAGLTRRRLYRHATGDWQRLDCPFHPLELEQSLVLPTQVQRHLGELLLQIAYQHGQAYIDFLGLGDCLSQFLVTGFNLREVPGLAAFVGLNQPGFGSSITLPPLLQLPLPDFLPDLFSWHPDQTIP